MKTLLLLRHAKSSWKQPSAGDHERKLKKRGRKDAGKAGQLLTAEGLLPDLILSSTARRCRQTVEQVIHHSDYRGEARMIGELYEADGAKIREIVSKMPDNVSRVAIVAHNPGMEEFLEGIVGEHTPLPTAALAVVELPINAWSDLNAETRGNVTRAWQPQGEKSGGH
jgi:phosphohistidine phosphatase